MILYHFTSQRKADSILREGLNRGAIVFPGHTVLKPMIWLTQDNRFSSQHWATDNLGICGDRTEVRLTVRLPDDHNLFRWNLYAHHNMKICREDLRYFNEAGGSDGEAWWVYIGTLSAKYIIEISEKDRKT